MRIAVIIGVDFDNTIVCYDDVFLRAARERGLFLPKAALNKNSIRDYLRKAGEEDAWTELQGIVYGVYIKYASAFQGVMDFFRHSQERGIKVYIISHKTLYPFIGDKHNLHKAAHDWLKMQGFYDRTGIGVPAESVFFELSKEEKIKRIVKLGCSHFIDDLPEFLQDPAFPAGVRRILFDPAGNYQNCSVFYRAKTWSEIDRRLIKGRTKVNAHS